MTTLGQHERRSWKRLTDHLEEGVPSGINHPSLRRVVRNKIARPGLDFGEIDGDDGDRDEDPKKLMLR